MGKIREFLDENKIAYKEERFGNPYYFDDGFFVNGISVRFDFGIDNKAGNKMLALEKFMKRKKSYVLTNFSTGYGRIYRIFTKSDYERLTEHEKRIQDAAKKFWEERHMAAKSVEDDLETLNILRMKFIGIQEGK